ncbi:MAG: DMT family transporter [Bacteriovoracaceae bacterium]|nr:DMT family transporter [Bacteriovoracaceae bacterium]
MKGILLIFLACLLWACDTLIRYPLLGSGMAATKIVLTEHLILTLLFSWVVYKSRKKIWSMQVGHISYFIVIGGLGSALGTLSFTKAFTMINPSMVIILQKLQPLVAITLARFVLGEKIKKEFILWAIPCLIGGLMVSYKDIFPGLKDFDFSTAFSNPQALAGLGLTLVSIISWGASTPFGKKLSKEGYKETEIMFGRFSMGLLCLLPFITMEEVTFDNDAVVWGKLSAMVLLSGILGMWFYYTGLKKLPARICALAEMAFPFFAILVNWVFLGATLDLLQIMGGVLLLLSSTMIQLKHY